MPVTVERVSASPMPSIGTTGAPPKLLSVWSPTEHRQTILDAAFLSIKPIVVSQHLTGFDSFLLPDITERVISDARIPKIPHTASNSGTVNACLPAARFLISVQVSERMAVNSVLVQ